MFWLWSAIYVDTWISKGLLTYEVSSCHLPHASELNLKHVFLEYWNPLHVEMWLLHIHTVKYNACFCSKTNCILLWTCGQFQRQTSFESWQFSHLCGCGTIHSAKEPCQWMQCPSAPGAGRERIRGEIKENKTKHDLWESGRCLFFKKFSASISGVQLIYAKPFPCSLEASGDMML